MRRTRQTHELKTSFDEFEGFEARDNKFQWNAPKLVTVLEQVRSGDTYGDVPPATIFSYLTKLVDPKVRYCIDGLPFAIEGYQRAKKHPNMEVW